MHVFVLITTLDHQLALKMEPRACAPHKRLQTIASLRANGIPVGVLVAPIIPGLIDSALEQILSAAADAGAERAAYVMLRLPHEVKPLFFEWAQTEYENRVDKIRRHLQSMYSGNEYQSAFGQRMTGSGPIAKLIAARFRHACRKLNISQDAYNLDTTPFFASQLGKNSGQVSLF